MHAELKIFTEQLRPGLKKTINLSVDPTFLDIQENELKFEAPVQIKGEVYTTESHLILHLSCSTDVKIPCAICNELFTFPLVASEIYATEVLEELPSTVFDFSDLLRAELLLLLPPFAECHEGNCPERVHISPFLRKKEPKEHHPFSEL